MKVEEMAEKLLLRYIQHWGQSTKERSEILINAAKFCGFKTVKLIEQNNEIFVGVLPDEQIKFTVFRERIKNIMRNEFEHEVAQLTHILNDFICLNNPTNQ